MSTIYGIGSDKSDLNKCREQVAAVARERDAALAKVAELQAVVKSLQDTQCECVDCQDYRAAALAAQSAAQTEASHAEEEAHRAAYAAQSANGEGGGK